MWCAIDSFEFILERFYIALDHYAISLECSLGKNNVIVIKNMTS